MYCFTRRLATNTPIDDWLRTGLVIEFLGTSSAKPTKTRNVSSLLLHHAKGTFMFDCGDGTLRQLLNSPIARASRMEAIFITHLHSDHFYGLPGVSVAIGDTENSSNGGPMKRKCVFSPKGLRSKMGSLLERNIDISEFGFQSTVGSPRKHYDCTLPFHEHVIYSTSDLEIAAIFIQHSVPCVGYIVREKPIIKVNSQLLQTKYNLPPGPIYGQLQRLLPITVNGITIKPEEVTMEVPSRNIVILGDTCNPAAIVPYAMNCDVLVHEATGVESDKAQILQTFHSTGSMAGEFAKRVRAKHLIINHFSPRHVMAGVPCDEVVYQKQILKEAKEAAGGSVLVTAAYDHLAIPIPRRSLL